jgi:hypothetical protein
MNAEPWITPGGGGVRSITSAPSKANLNPRMSGCSEHRHVGLLRHKGEPSPYLLSKQHRPSFAKRANEGVHPPLKSHVKTQAG